MQKVGHDRGIYGRIGFYKLTADAHKSGMCRPHSQSKPNVDLRNFFACGIFRLASWRNVQHQNLRVGALRAEQLDHRVNARDNVIRAVIVHIVGANHQHNDFGFDRAQWRLL